MVEFVEFFQKRTVELLFPSGTYRNWTSRRPDTFSDVVQTLFRMLFWVRVTWLHCWATFQEKSLAKRFPCQPRSYNPKHISCQGRDQERQRERAKEEIQRVRTRELRDACNANDKQVGHTDLRIWMSFHCRFGCRSDCRSGPANRVRTSQQCFAGWCSSGPEIPQLFNDPLFSQLGTYHVHVEIPSDNDRSSYVGVCL